MLFLDRLVLAAGRAAFCAGGSDTATCRKALCSDLGRFAKDGLSAVKGTENVSRMIDLQSTALSSNLTVEEVSELKRNVFNAQVMLTNLGCLPFDSTFGPLKLETLWAPYALRDANAVVIAIAGSAPHVLIGRAPIGVQ